MATKQVAAVGGVAILAVAMLLAARFLVAEAGPSVAPGQLIYRSGILPSGEPLTGTVQGDVAFTGAQASCASCHRRSGFGSSESGRTTPPVVGQFLYQPVGIGAEQTGLRRSHGPGTRPAYTDETLARAIRQGIDPAGRALAPLMPRFELSDSGVGALVAYLKSLPAGPSPGVTEGTVHLATVVTPGVAPARRGALLDVLRAFVADRNADSRLEEERKIRGGWEMRRKHEAYRKLTLHEWELAGLPATWRAQLEERYRTEPVFVLLSGIGEGEWRPIHEFCEANQIPSLFPITDYPGITESDYYSFYFSRGLALEAEALASHLRAVAAVGSVVQIFRPEANGVVPAAALRTALEHDPQVRVLDRPIHAAAPPDHEFWRSLLAETRPAALVLWLREADLAEFAGTAVGGTEVFLSGTLVAGKTEAIPGALGGRANLTWPYALPSVKGKQTARARAWIEARGLKMVDGRVQTGAFFAASLLSDGLKELHGYYVRDYLIERIEHMVDSSVTTSVYPRLSLAPGVRFASKGCYIVRLTDDDPPTPVAVSDWIVP